MVSLITQTITNTNDNFFHSLFSNLLSGFLFLIIYEFLFKNGYVYWKNRKFIGRYIHCNLEYHKISTNNNIHYSDITINFCQPNILNIVSFDFTGNKKSKWIGRIKIDSDTGLHGFGTYKYSDDNFMGIHDILVIDNDTISFQLSYFKQPGAPYLMVKENSGKVNR